jgi:HSP20 family protein
MATITDKVEKMDVVGPNALSLREPFDDWWTPFMFSRRFGEDFDRLFEGLGPGRDIFRPVWWGGGTEHTTWRPAIEMFERDNTLIVRVELPGLTRKDINVEVLENLLTIEGERHVEKKEKSKGVYRNERYYGKFYRALPLPDGVDPETAKATFRDGILEIEMAAPVRKEHHGRRLALAD